jgi:hypothetical protein
MLTFLEGTNMTKSSAPANERLREHLGRLVDEIQATISSGLYSGSPEAVASNREEVLSEILSRFLPRTFDLGKARSTTQTTEFQIQLTPLY